MISRHRIKAYMLRHVYEMWATFDRKFDIIFWPTIDLLIFGLLSIHVQKLSTQANLSGAIIGGLILWTLVYSVQRDISVSLLEDAWSRNLYNLFSTPLKAGEMLIGVMLLSIGKAIITVSFVTLLAWGLFGFKLFSVWIEVANFCLVPDSATLPHQWGILPPFYSAGSFGQYRKDPAAQLYF